MINNIKMTNKSKTIIINKNIINYISKFLKYKIINNIN